MATYDELLGTEVYDVNGDKIGKLDNFYTSEDESTPDLITVRTGFWGNRVSFVPLEYAKETEDGVQVNFTKDQVKDAPHIEADQEVSTEEENKLYDYYGRLSGDKTGAAGSRRDASDTDRSGAMTRSEEELRVDKRQVETGRVRLKKYIVTENVNFTVPIKKEKARLVREPITDSNRDAATKGPDLSEREHEVILHEEQIDVGKTVTPRERVRLDKEVVENQQEVNEDVRKEQIEVEDDDDELQQ